MEKTIAELEILQKQAHLIENILTTQCDGLTSEQFEKLRDLTWELIFGISDTLEELRK